jgi:ABC-type anion transport system duplicated permease subunit
MAYRMIASSHSNWSSSIVAELRVATETTSCQYCVISYISARLDSPELSSEAVSSMTN